MRKGEWIMKKLILFGDSIMKGVTFNGSGYHLCPATTIVTDCPTRS
mgnify:CR=1 FL=1